MESPKWTTQRIAQIRPEEFYMLIKSNKSHIEKTFPVTLSNCENLEKTIAFIAKNTEKENNKEGYYFYIRDIPADKLIGYVCVKNINDAIRKCELAYFIDHEFEGRGIITEAVFQTLDFCFNELDMNKTFICTSKVNLASQRIALKHGFEQEGLLREEFRNGEGILEDILYFGLLKSKHYER